jgi:hypothetical protein
MSKKHLFKNNACSQGGVTWQMMQYAWGSVTLTSPIIFFHRGSYNKNSLGTFRYHLVHGLCVRLHIETYRSGH